MDPPPKPAPTSTSLFQVYLRLRPPPVPSQSSSVPSSPSKSLYPVLPVLSSNPGERFLVVEPSEEPISSSSTESHGSEPHSAESHDSVSPMPTHITIHPPHRGDTSSRKRAVEKFAFTKVFEENRSQLDVFHGTGVQSVVEGVVKDGRDGVVATLGVTGSGKTHTILGSKTQRGMTQLSLDLLFSSLKEKMLHPGQSPLLVSSLMAADASEAQILSAANFLDGVFGEGMGSRAQTPMTVGDQPFPFANASKKLKGGMAEQWEVLGIVRNFTPVGEGMQMKKIVTKERWNPPRAELPSKLPFWNSPPLTKSKAKRRFGDFMQDTTVHSTPSRRHMPQMPSALPTLPDISDAVVASTHNADYTILISMYEVYNDRIFDLLSPQQRNTKEARRRPLLFKSTEGSPDRKVVAGLRKVVCGTYEEALIILETGLMERRVAGTGSNSVSSRSHGFFCVEVKKRVKGGMAGNWHGSHLTIVDLAGSERARNARTAGATLAEAGKINESLMYLGQCLQMHSDSADASRPGIVPFRQCKLTELLFSNSFPSHTSTTTTQHHPRAQKAVMIVTADPLGDFNATSQILRYSALAREVTVPRIPSVASLVFEGKPIPSGKTSGRNSPDDNALRETEAELSRIAEQLDVLTVQLAEERVRRREAEAGWQRAESRMEEAEQTVREEVWAEFEAKMHREQRRWLDAMGEEADRFDERVDKKLDLLQQMDDKSSSAINIFEDSSATPATKAEIEIKMARLAEVESENAELKARLRRLETELLGRSPSKCRSASKQGLGSPPVLDFSASLGSNASPVGIGGVVEDQDSSDTPFDDLDFDKENAPASGKAVSAVAAFKALQLGDDSSLALGDVDSADDAPLPKGPARRVTRSSAAGSPLKNKTSPGKTKARIGDSGRPQRILTPHRGVAKGFEDDDPLY